MVLLKKIKSIKSKNKNNKIKNPGLTITTLS